MKTNEELIADISDKTATLTRIISAVDQLHSKMRSNPTISFGITSNVSVDMLSIFLRKHALLHGLKLSCEVCGHDDALNNIQKNLADGIENMIYLLFFDNLMPGFENQIATLSDEKIADVDSNFRARTKLVFETGKALSMIYMGTFHRYNLTVDTGAQDRGKIVLDLFNTSLQEIAAPFQNVRLIDTSDIIQTLGTEKTFDRRFYLQNTAPYKPSFFDEFSRRLALSSRGFGTYFYKALVLDCDNTLWGGVVGEDSVDGIQLDPHSYPGRVYWHAQHTFAGLERNGALLCLCSKNNPEDVDMVLSTHPHQVLKDSHIILKKVNWSPKVENLKAIAQDLNIGLESLVFLDDSAFECDSVRAALPQVRVIQVPSSLQNYPQVIREVRELFDAAGLSAESRSKTSQYIQIQKASADSIQFESHEEYLKTLDLCVKLKRNSAKDIPRISELTRKSNQFNLTTLRQTVGDITKRMSDPFGSVYSLEVSDRFGAAGITGIAIVEWSGEVASVEAFLMSCRVIGRGVEFSIWSEIAKDAAKQGCRFLEAKFIPSAKNQQVSDFFNKLGILPIAVCDNVTYYKIGLDQFSPPEMNYIKVFYDI